MATGLHPLIPMRTLTLILSALLAMAAVGCSSSSDSDDVQAQAFTSRLSLIGKGSGGVTGRVIFPSEFTQRSAAFYVDQVKFATLPDGRFRVTTIPVGQHEVRVLASGFEPVTVPVSVRDGNELAMKPIQLRIARGKVIGRLVDEKGQSATGIAVHLKPFGGATYTDQDGIFQFMGVGPGDLVLGVDDPYFTRQPQRFLLTPDEQRNLGNITVGRAQTSVSGRTAELAHGGESPR